MGNIGYFNNEKKEYTITQMRPRRPLKNFLWNEQFIMILDHFGFGESFRYITPEERRFVVMDGEAGRLIYIKDRVSGEFYDANRNYQNKPFDKYECHVGIGYQQIVSEYKGLEVTYTLAAPVEGFAELWKIEVANNSKAEKKIDLIPYCRPAVNITSHLAYGHADYEEKLGGLYFCHDAYQISHNYVGVYMKATLKPDSYDVSDINFKGIYHSYADPQALSMENLSNKGSSFDPTYCGAMRFALELSAGERKTVYVVLGMCTNLETAVCESDRFLKPGFFEESVAKVKADADQMDSLFVLRSPDEYINTMVNIWLKRQISLGKTWGRVYNKGFRDIMQDTAGLAAFDGSFAREKIMLCLSTQRPDGNPMRSFAPIDRDVYHDGAVWTPETVLAYLNETGDLSLLEEEVPYFESEESGTVFEHMYRGLRFLLDHRGSRNMVLWGGGDWNDSINNAGNQMKGESAWLSIATVKAVKEFCRICEIVGGKEELIARLLAEREELKKAVLENAFEGDQFIYGINDWDEKVGSHESREAKTYLNPQTWAVLADMLDEKGLRTVMQTVEEKLSCDFGYLQCAPAYSQKDPHIGRMAYFIPGGYENGSVYNHGVAFKIAADCKLGKADLAFDTLKRICYDNPKNANSGVEPYVITNMYFGPQEKYRPGFSYYAWFTGAAGWVYRDITEFILGIKGEYTGLKIKPCIPSAWNGVFVSRVYRGARYNITFQRTGVARLVVDGKETDGDIVPIFPKNTEHTVICEV